MQKGRRLKAERENSRAHSRLWRLPVFGAAWCRDFCGNKTHGGVLQDTGPAFIVQPRIAAISSFMRLPAPPRSTQVRTCPASCARARGLAPRSCKLQTSSIRCRTSTPRARHSRPEILETTAAADIYAAPAFQVNYRNRPRSSLARSESSQVRPLSQLYRMVVQDVYTPKPWGLRNQDKSAETICL